MGSPLYALLAGLVLYFLMARMVAQEKIHFVTASLMAVLGYFVVATLINSIIYAAYNISASQLFSPMQIVTVVVQCAVALISFYKISQDESYGAGVIWGAAGCVGIFFIVPIVVQNVTAGL